MSDVKIVYVISVFFSRNQKSDQIVLFKSYLLLTNFLTGTALVTKE